MALLKLSYNKPPSYLKSCFAYLLLFVKDAPLYSDHVIYWWSALGLLQKHGETEIENIGYSYFLELISRSLIYDPDLLAFNNMYLLECKMHDIMHDLATNSLEEEISIVTQDKMQVSTYTRHLIWGYEGSNSLKEATFPKELCKAHNIRSFKFGYQMNLVSQSLLEGIISNFTNLRILDLCQIPFEELPRPIGKLKHLRFLDLSYNWAIKSLPDSICKLLNLEVLLIGCEKLTKLPNDVHLLQSLRMFGVTTWQVSIGTNFNSLSHLRSLEFAFCESLTSLWDDYNVGSLTSLRFLAIRSCPKLTNLPKSMKFFIRLETLLIENCEMLDLEVRESLQGLQKLRQLVVVGVPKLIRLPPGIQSVAASLRDLGIGNCTGLMELPKWIPNFTSLHRVELSMCPNLLSLPTVEYYFKK